MIGVFKSEVAKKRTPGVDEKETAMDTAPEVNRRDWLKVAAASTTGVLLGGYSVLVRNVAAAGAEVVPGNISLKVAKVRFENRALTSASQAEIVDSLAPMFLQLAKQTGPLQESDAQLLSQIKGLTRVKGAITGGGAEVATTLEVGKITVSRTKAPLERRMLPAVQQGTQ